MVLINFTVIGNLLLFPLCLCTVVMPRLNIEKKYCSVKGESAVQLKESISFCAQSGHYTALLTPIYIYVRLNNVFSVFSIGSQCLSSETRVQE